MATPTSPTWSGTRRAADQPSRSCGTRASSRRPRTSTSASGRTPTRPAGRHLASGFPTIPDLVSSANPATSCGPPRRRRATSGPRWQPHSAPVTASPTNSWIASSPRRCTWTWSTSTAPASSTPSPSIPSASHTCSPRPVPITVGRSCTPEATPTPAGPSPNLAATT